MLLYSTISFSFSWRPSLHNRLSFSDHEILENPTACLLPLSQWVTSRRYSTFCERDCGSFSAPFTFLCFRLSMSITYYISSTKQIISASVTPYDLGLLLIYFMQAIGWWCSLKGHSSERWIGAQCTILYFLMLEDFIFRIKIFIFFFASSVGLKRQAQMTSNK